MIDHRTLLMKYINHVGEREGVTFTNDWQRTDAFTDEEWTELQKLDREAASEIPA